MPDKDTTTFVNDPALGALCAWLGQIPIGQLPILNSEIPIQWDTFSVFDWGQLVSKAQIQGLAPLMYWLLSKSGKFSSIPEPARNSLRLNYSVTWIKNQIIFKELESLAKTFKQADIPLVLLKGACFALTIYPDIGLRPMGDLDILVPGSRLSKAVQIAQSFGYVDTIPDASPGLRALLNHEICMQKTGPQAITLEIHNSLVADKAFSYAVPVDWFWEQSEPLGGTLQARFEPLRMLTPTAQVLYAAAHAMLQHGGKVAPLCWFFDLDRLIRSYDGRMDWDLLLSQARIFEWGSALDVALVQTHACFRTPIPEYVWAGLSEHADRHRKLVALKQVRPATHILEEFQKLQSLNWYGRFRLVTALIAPSPTYMRWRYGLKTSWEIPAYYVIRWWGILKDGFRSLVSLFKKGSSNNLV